MCDCRAPHGEESMMQISGMLFREACGLIFIHFGDIVITNATAIRHAAVSDLCCKESYY